MKVGGALLCGALLLAVGLGFVGLEDREKERMASGQMSLKSVATVPTSPQRLRVAVRGVRAHDRHAYTQGLLLHGDMLYESTGGFGESTLRRVDASSGEVLERVNLDERQFGEGLARVGDRLIQLTWHSGLAFVYALPSLERLGSFEYSGEGWGLCYDGRRLVMSDGTAALTFRDAQTFAESSRLKVTLEGKPLAGLNELECAEGWIYANVYTTDQIVRIDPFNGEVRAVVHAGGLLNKEERLGAEVLNGIAFDPSTGNFLLTGKRWPKLFEVEFQP